jgi:hypothetical protein
MTQDPQAVPETAPQAVPHSSAPKVLGVLSIIFASLTLAFTALGGLTSSAMRGSTGAMSTAPAAQAMAHYQEAIRVPSYVNMAVLIVLSLALLMVGAGQVGYRRWAASFSVLWGALALVALGGMIAMNVVWMAPAKDAFMAEMARAASAVGGREAAIQSLVFSSMGGSWIVYLSLIPYAPYPLLLLLYFTRAKVRQSMTR